MIDEPDSRSHRWFYRLADWCGRNGRTRIIPDRVDPHVPYLARHYLIGGRGSRFFTLAVHEILRSDPDGLHDHPWCYATVILQGGYWEHTPRGRFWRGPGTILFRRPSSLHRLELDPTAPPCVTLFAMGPRVREWGFLNAAGKWVDHETHLAKAWAKRLMGRED